MEVWFQILLGSLQAGATGAIAYYTWRAGIELPRAEADLRAAGYSADLMENAAPDVPNEGNFGAAEPLLGIATREADRTPEIAERRAALSSLNMLKRAAAGRLNEAQLQERLQKAQLELKDKLDQAMKRPRVEEVRPPDLSAELIDWIAWREWIARGLEWKVPFDEPDAARAVRTALRWRMESIYPALVDAAKNRKHAAWTPGQRSRLKEAVQRGDVMPDFIPVGGLFMPLVRMVQLRQEAALACGLEDEAADLTQVLFACRDLTAGDASLIDFLICSTVDRTILDAARRSMRAGKLNATLLAGYQTFFASHSGADHFDRAMRMELAASQYMMKQVAEQHVSLNAFQSIFGLSNIDRYKGQSSPLTRGVTQTFFELARALHIQNHLAGLRALKSGGMMGYYRWAKDFDSRAKPQPLDVLRPHYLLAAGSMTGYAALMPGLIYGEMNRRAFVVECALERHRLAGGAIPATLKALPKELLREIPLDLDGQPIRYRLERNARVVWSVGLDLKDEQRAEAPLAPPKGMPRREDPHMAADWLWWHVTP